MFVGTDNSQIYVCEITDKWIHIRVCDFGLCKRTNQKISEDLNVSFFWGGGGGERGKKEITF